MVSSECDTRRVKVQTKMLLKPTSSKLKIRVFHASISVGTVGVNKSYIEHVQLENVQHSGGEPEQPANMATHD